MRYGQTEKDTQNIQDDISGNGARADEDRGSGKRPFDKMTVCVYAACAVIFAGFILHGLIADDSKPEADAAVTSQTSVSTASSRPETTTSAARTSETSAEVEGMAFRAAAAVTEKPVTTVSAAKKKSSTTTAPQTTAPVETLRLTTSPVTTVTAAPDVQTVSSATQTAPPVTSAPTSTQTTTVSTTRITGTTRYKFPADINTITYEGLLQVPGIGEKTAQQIIDFREQNGVIYNMAQLLEIYGIGENTLNGFSGYLYIRDEDYSEITTTTAETTMIVTTTPVMTAPPSRHNVDINSADAEELARKLLLPPDKAEAIVSVREQIGDFSKIEELLIVDGLSGSDISNIKDYITIDETGEQ